MEVESPGWTVVKLKCRRKCPGHRCRNTENQRNNIGFLLRCKRIRMLWTHDSSSVIGIPSRTFKLTYRKDTIGAHTRWHHRRVWQATLETGGDIMMIFFLLPIFPNLATRLSASVWLNECMCECAPESWSWQANVACHSSTSFIHSFILL